MPSLAWKNTLQDRPRLAVTLTGITFALVLVAVQLGLFLGFTRTTSNIIDHSGADLWICARSVPYFDVASVLQERRVYQVLAVPGVSSAEKLIVRFSTWKRPDGGEETVEIVGFNPQTGAGGPWDIRQGAVTDLLTPDTVMIDESYRDKLGVSGLGQMVEIHERRARVAGFTHGIRSFTTAPFVFTSFRNALDYAGLKEDETIYILVRAAAGADLESLRRRIAREVPGVDVYTTAQFSRKTENYWMFTTGAGIALLIAAAMGFAVGIAVVAQTLYASTVDRLREFGTLKAIGAGNGYLCGLVARQAMILAVAGYALAIGASVLMVRVAQHSGAPIVLPWQLALLLLVLAFFMSLGGALFSIRKALAVDPSLVMRL
jgi:putative ABC transport system permease protein